LAGSHLLAVRAVDPSGVRSSGHARDGRVVRAAARRPRQLCRASGCYSGPDGTGGRDVWIASPAREAADRVVVAKAVPAGHLEPLGETSRDTLAWDADRERPAAELELTPVREAERLAELS
jgi:hypothetical protein